ncbi:MAG: hypothetical protein R3D62_09895 [Xanthobacteraceae bacterium]
MIRPGLTGERLSALFLLGLVLLLPPLIGLFDKPVLVAGIPLLYLSVRCLGWIDPADAGGRAASGRG